MFEAFCPSHQSSVLLSTSNITAIHNTSEGVVVAWRCWCGHAGETDHTTRPSLPLPQAG
jgi:hypothetical protein